MKKEKKELVKKFKVVIEDLMDHYEEYTEEEQENLREEFRGHIRGTEGYQKMILSGDGNISTILNDPGKMDCVYADIFNEIVQKMEKKERSSTNDEPQRSNEKEMNQGEMAPKTM